MEARDDPPDPGVLREADKAADSPTLGSGQPQAERNLSLMAATAEQVAEVPATPAEIPANALAEPESEPSQDSNEGHEAQERSVPFNDLFRQMEVATEQEGLQNEQEVDTAQRLMQKMFTTVFNQHEQKELPEEKASYPTLQLEELRGLIQLFRLEVQQHNGTAQAWRRRLRGLVAAIFDSRRSLADTIALKESEIKVHHARNENPWANNPLLSKVKNDEDDPMGEEIQSNVVRFKTDVYTMDEITVLRAIYEAPYEFPTELREPSDSEKRIIQGLLEGTILAQELPQFLKRTCNNEMLRVIQNTIHAQVEGELMFRLPGQFPMYPDFQTRDRLCNAVLQGAKGRGFDMEQLTQMLGETKQVCYNVQQHSVHLIYWTREAAAKWANIYKSIPFRSRCFVLMNVHPDDANGDGTSADQAARVWARQVGRDGIKNERQHDRYKIKLLNISRFIDEAAVDAFFRSKFRGEFRTYQEPTSGRQALQTGTWEIFFRSTGCPSFLEGIRFINWLGTKLLIHHVGRSPASPCYNCGKPGHTVAQCRASSDYWKTAASCITVTAPDIAALTKQKSTIISFDELEDMWTRLQQPDESGEPQSSSSESELRAEETNRRTHAPNAAGVSSTDWITSQSRGRRGSPGKAYDGRSASISAPLQSHDEDKQQEVIDLTSVSDSQPEFPADVVVEPNEQVNTGPRCIRRPAALTKQQRLIFEAVARRNPAPQWGDTLQLQNLVVGGLNLKKNTGNRVLEHSGLQPVVTPGTGNCQYYAIAMALLGADFTNAEDAKAIENLTAKLKKGMQLAMSHGFDEEYQHDERKIRLLACMDSTSGMSERESKQLLMEYMEDIGQSSSKSTSFLAKSLWGSDLTLRLAAKLLQRPNYVLIARQGLDQPCYQVFEPNIVLTAEFTLESAKEVMISKTEPKRWLERLQDECKNPRGKDHLPIVLKYGAEHYAWLRFGKKTPVVHPEMKQPKAEDPPPAIEETEESKTEELDPPSCDAEDDSKKQVTPVESRLEAAMNQPDLAVTNCEERGDIKEHDGDRLEERPEFSAVGAFGLAPVVQKLLLELDWDNPAQLQALVTMTGADSDTLKHWQQQLHANEVVSAGTPEDSDVDMEDSQDASWSPPTKTTGSKVRHGPDPPDTDERIPPNAGSGRFSSHRNSASAGRRGEHSQRDQWNAQERDWKQLSNLNFPALPADTKTWKNAVKAHPTPLLQSLQTMDSPVLIVRSVNAGVLQEWTRRYRVDCLIQGLSETIAHQVDETAKADLTTEIDFLKAKRDEMTNDTYIHGRDYWIKLRKYDPDKNDLLKYCRKAQSTHLARLVVAAFAYGPEVAAISGRPCPNVATTVPLMKNLLWLLKHDGGVKKAFYAQDSDGDLAGLEAALASRTPDMQTKPEVMK